MQKDLDEDEKQRLMKEHDANMKKFEENLKSEQDRTKEMLRKKLEERRRKKRSLEMGKIREDFADDAKQADADERRKLAALQTEGAKVLAAATPALGAKQMKEKCRLFLFVSTINSIYNQYIIIVHKNLYLTL